MKLFQQITGQPNEEGQLEKRCTLLKSEFFIRFIIVYHYYMLKLFTIWLALIESWACLWNSNVQSYSILLKWKTKTEFPKWSISTITNQSFWMGKEIKFFVCSLARAGRTWKKKSSIQKMAKNGALSIGKNGWERKSNQWKKKYADDDENLTFIHHFAFMLLFFFQAYLFHHFGELAHSHWLLLENICFEKHKNEISKSTHIFYSGYTFRWHYWSESFVFVYWMRACVRLLSMCTRFSSANLSTL